MTAPVCFAGMTALRIIRVASPSDLEPVSKRGFLPEEAPTKRDLDAAIRSLLRAYPMLEYAVNPTFFAESEKVEPGLGEVAADGGAAFRRIEIATSSGSRRKAPDGYAFHFCRSVLSSGMVLKLGKGLLVAAPALALTQVAARTHGEIPLLELVWEVCGTYQTELTALCSAYERTPLTSVSDLSKAQSLNSKLHGSRRLGRALRFAADGSASPRETKLALLLGMPMRYGGYGLGIPAMNWEVSATDTARRAAGRGSFRCDLCWPEARLDVEYQSRERHGNELSRISDSKRANALASMDWTVVGVTNGELNSPAAMESVAQAVRRHLGKSERIFVKDYAARKRRLRRALGLPTGYAAYSPFGER